MSFKFPVSSPPSTPDKPQSPFSNISTTPAGPPPSSTRGNSRMGSRSNINFGESTFSQSGNFGGNNSLFSSISSDVPSFPNQKGSVFSGSFGNFGDFGNKAGGFSAVNCGNNLKVRNRKPHGLSQMTTASEDWEDEEDVEEEEDAEPEDGNEYSDEVEEDYEDEEGEGEEDQDEEEYEDDENSVGDVEMDATSDFAAMQTGFSNSIFKGFGQSSAPAQKRIYSNPNNAKRAKLDEKWATSSPQAANNTIGPRKTPSQFPSIANNLASQAKTSAVTESGEVVLQTDYYIDALLDKLQENEPDDAEALALLSEAAAALTDFWDAASEKKREQTGQYRPHDDFGPGERASGLENATVVASLLLQLHHPRVKSYDRRELKPAANGQELALVVSTPKTYTPIPKILVDWLNANHLGSLHEMESLQQASPNPTASPHFWEIIQAGVLRGRFSEIAALLRSADFNYARSALEDGFSQPGYRGMQLQAVQKTVNKAIQMLEASPINQDDDWNVIGSDWAAYRKRIQSAQIELQELAEGDKTPNQAGGPRFEASQFGVSTQSFAPSQSGFSFTQTSRMAESLIPWSIYQGISNIYGVILGKPSVIMSVAQDWIEATIGLTAWWDGQELGNNGVFGNREQATDVERQDAYLRRLNDCFGEVIDGSEMQSRPNPLVRLDVAVTCVFEGNVSGTIKLLQTWSLCIAAAVAEIAHEGGWLEMSTANMPGFLNRDDLMVLSYGQNDDAALDQISKDEVLDVYAEKLGDRDQFEYNGTVRKGWELALEVLSRMEDNKTTRERVSALLNKIPVGTVQQVDRVITLCIDLGFEDEGRKIAANFGEKIIAAGQARADCDYGLAMICFARARSVRKVKEIANSLIAYSLQQSRAWPPAENLGGQLRSLVQNPKVCLSSIAAVDSEAAQIIQFYASGYATLRRFYDLRDEPVLSKGSKPHLRPLARKRAAAEALVAVIRSSADSIYGGLYDPERDSAVLVDNLMALLGEAVLFVSETPSTLSIEQQSNILAAIEDLETVTPRVFAAAQEFFYECLNEYIYETTGEPRKSSPSPRLTTGLKKSTSGLTASSSFSMIDSHMADSSVTQATNNTMASSGVLVPKPDTEYEYAKPIERGWDWRIGLAESSAVINGGTASEVEDDIKPDEKLLRVLRLRLAQGMTWQ
ncbi:hypothetical protein TMatcc_010699 [Talaromyces marneffei ATCC 18224]|uniref:Nuclear pore complex protein Nup85 n=1 Tax=Talaromyces marneffei (strain ATCC 18224 / CBS 334.59 / QM 7333) TaxID=441960 RepID=B6QUV2_TALMQ|nr:uncharacterized protein EYB26_009537 [Talaromyces marneffei]EEA18759.1 nuclear pore complex subunit Nup85, putative [Talaromyces marneffei ATCC 18224]KAE8548482.1 hypothetical protein EYB25_008860 [Talaromyces marneffei]QGA21826.1 hypothetical protein EYB26_009537 [Talaromyces marneffei]